MRIAFTDNLNEKKFEQYCAWIRTVAPSVETVKLSPALSNVEELDTVNGLVLTGGGDVDGECYGFADADGTLREVNRDRDEFEFRVIERALDRAIPMLGVCRGMQVMNVYLGGTLTPDLMKAGREDHGQRGDRDGMHPIMPVPHSALAAVTGLGAQAVNSAHHQAVEHLGRGLMVSAVSKDGVAEAAEWSLKDDMPFLMLVQWHPERMEEKDSSCSRGIAALFVREVQHRQSQGNRVSSTSNDTTE
jgi:putative glutamine amidotransferase